MYNCICVWSLAERKSASFSQAAGSVDSGVLVLGRQTVAPVERQHPTRNFTSF